MSTQDLFEFAALCTIGRHDLCTGRITRPWTEHLVRCECSCHG